MPGWCIARSHIVDARGHSPQRPSSCLLCSGRPRQELSGRTANAHVITCPSLAPRLHTFAQPPYSASTMAASALTSLDQVSGKAFDYVIIGMYHFFRVLPSLMLFLQFRTTLLRWRDGRARRRRKTERRSQRHSRCDRSRPTLHQRAANRYPSCR